MALTHIDRRAGRWARRGIGLAASLTATLALGGCPHQNGSVPLSPPPPVSPGPRVEIPDGGMSHSVRLAWTGWSAAGAFQACARRFGDDGQHGKAGPCAIVRAPGAAAEQRPAPESGYSEDVAPVGFAPGACKVIFKDIPGDPGLAAGVAARAFLVGPSACAQLDAFRPPNQVDGDRFAIESSFSPDGRRLALIHSAIGLGDGESRVDIVAVEVRDAPACR